MQPFPFLLLATRQCIMFNMSTRLYGQRDTDIAKLYFGTSKSTSSYGKYGCYVISLLNGLRMRGWEYIPTAFNTMLNEKGAYITTNPYCYIDVDNIAREVPQIFTSYQRVNTYTGDPHITKYLEDPEYVVLTHLDAKAIGGSGTHFALLVGYDGEPVILDPWTNRTEKVSKTYGKYGGVLGLRVFKVKVQSIGEGGDNMAEIRPSYLKQLLAELGVGDNLPEGAFKELWQAKVQDPISQYQTVLGLLEQEQSKMKAYNEDLLAFKEATDKITKIKTDEIARLSELSSQQLLTITLLQEELANEKAKLTESSGWKQKLLSRKLIAAIAGVLVTVLNRYVGLGLTVEDITQVLTILGGYILAEGVIDTVKTNTNNNVSNILAQFNKSQTPK